MHVSVWSRREWLAASGAGVAATFTGLARARHIEPSAFIDAHSHVWSSDLDRFPLIGDQNAGDLDPPEFRPERLMALARPHGVGRVVLIQHQIYHGFDNRYLVHVASENPATFRVVGAVDPGGENPAGRMRRLLGQHVTGFRITPWMRPDDWPDGDGFQAMWRTAAETRQPICCLINPEHLVDIDRMCARFPQTPVVIDHFARIGIDGAVRAADLAQLTRLARHEQVAVKVSAFYALGTKQPPYTDLVPMIRAVHDAFGADRLMWGSDAPYQVMDPHSYAASVALVRDQLDFLDEDERRALLGGTAERVFFFR